MLALGMLVNGSAVTIGSQRFLRGRPAGAFILVWRLDDGIVVAEISQEEVASREPARTWTRSRHWEPASDEASTQEAIEYFLGASGLGQ